MNISISKKEYDAIYFALDQVSSAIEGSSDEDYYTAAKECVDNLYNIINKYKDQKEKYELFKGVRKELKRLLKDENLSKIELDYRTRNAIWKHKYEL